MTWRNLIEVRTSPYSIFPVSSNFINLLGSALALVRLSANMWVVGTHLILSTSFKSLYSFIRLTFSLILPSDTCLVEFRLSINPLESVIATILQDLSSTFPVWSWCTCHPILIAVSIASSSANISALFADLHTLAMTFDLQYIGAPVPSEPRRMITAPSVLLVLSSTIPKEASA